MNPYYGAPMGPAHGGWGISHAPSGAGGAAAPGEYEFNEPQNQVIRRLASAMSFVGTMFVVLAVITALACLFALVRGRLEGADKLISAVLYGVIGQYTRGAAKHFDSIVRTQGGDIGNLMKALGRLRDLYELQKVLVLIAIGLIALAAFIGFCVGLAGAAF